MTDAPDAFFSASSARKVSMAAFFARAASSSSHVKLEQIKLSDLPCGEMSDFAVLHEKTTHCPRRRLDHSSGAALDGGIDVL